jgi:HEAT repeat protein
MPQALQSQDRDGDSSRRPGAGDEKPAHFQHRDPVSPILALWALLAPGAARPAVPPDVQEVAALLHRAAEQRPAASEALTAALAALGPAALPDLFAVLAHGLAPDEPIDSLEEQALLETLVSFGAPPLRAFLDQRLGATAVSPEERDAMLDLLARFGTGRDVSLARRVIEAGDVRGLELTLEVSLGALLRRDERGVEPVRRWLEQAPLELAGSLVRALGASGSSLALSALTDLLGREPDLDPALVAEIGRLAESAPKPLDAAITSALALALEGDDVQLQREAALALGRAQDFGSCELLVALLEHENRGLREAALWSLERSTGLSFRGDVRRWATWLRGERGWFEQELPGLAADLSAPEARIALRALGEISVHRYRRHELAQELALALEHEAPEVRVHACLTLGRLSSSAALPGLLAALEDPDRRVAMAAYAALRQLGAAPTRTADGEPQEASAGRGSRLTRG